MPSSRARKKDPVIDYSRRFEKQLKKAPVTIQRSFRERLELFITEPAHPQLRNHALTGQWKGYRSINVTGDWRAIFSAKRQKNNTVILFISLGAHSQLYK